MEFSHHAFDFEEYRASMSEVERNTTEALPDAVAYLKKMRSPDSLYLG